MHLILALILLPLADCTTVTTKELRFNCQQSSEECANIAWVDMFCALSGVDALHNICRFCTPIDSCVALALADCYDSMEHTTKGLLLAFAHTVIAWCTHRHINELYWHRDCLAKAMKEALEQCESFNASQEANITQAFASARYTATSIKCAIATIGNTCSNTTARAALYQLDKLNQQALEHERVRIQLMGDEEVSSVNKQPKIILMNSARAMSGTLIVSLLMAIKL